MRSMGLDVGDGKIGVALTDPEGILASPFTIIHRSDETKDIEAIDTIVKQYQVKTIIVGLPRSMDGSLGRQAEKVEVFVQRLHQNIEVPIEFRDERLTTVSANRLIRDASPRKKGKVEDDAIAAALILQGFLDEAQDG